MDSKSHWDSYTMTESYADYGKGRSSKKKILCGFLKAAIFVLCAAGFGCQMTEYLTYFFTYPTVISIEMEKPKEFIAPAFTVCNTNPVQRSRYCSRYPNRCEKPQDMKSLCEKRPHYCSKNITDFLIPKEIYYSPNTDLNNLTKKDIEELGQDSLSFNSYYSRSTDRKIFFDSPHLLNLKPLSCWTRNDRFESNFAPEKVKFDESGYTHIGKFKLNVEEDEMFDPRTEPRVIFTVHSPYVPLNPHFRGEQMKPGNLYHVHINLEEERFLPLPYQTDCIDYEHLWNTSKGATPRSQQMCERSCEMNISMEYYGCLYGIEMYDNLKGICNESISNLIKNRLIYIEEDKMWEKLRYCRRMCKKECVKRKYPFTIVERQDENLVRDRNGRRLILIELFVDDPEVKVLSHKPRYMDVELFSYIGGFIGLWLGISIWSLAGIIGRIFSDLIGLCRRKEHSKEENAKRRAVLHAPPLPFGTLVILLMSCSLSYNVNF